MGILEKVKAFRAQVDESRKSAAAAERQLLLEIAIRDVMETANDEDPQTADALMFSLGVTEAEYVALVDSIREAVEVAAEAEFYSEITKSGDLHAEERKRQRLMLIAKSVMDRHSRLAYTAKELRRAEIGTKTRLANITKSRPELFTGGQIKEVLRSTVTARKQQLVASHRETEKAKDSRFLGDLNGVLERQGHEPVDAFPELLPPPKASGRAGK